MSSWKHISVNPIAGALGAEVSGVHLGDLGETLSTKCAPHSLSIRYCSFATRKSRAISTKPSLGASARSRFIRSCSRSRTRGIPVRGAAERRTASVPCGGMAQRRDFYGRAAARLSAAMRGGAGVWRRHDVGEHVRGLRGAIGQDAADALRSGRDSRYREHLFAHRLPH